MNKVSESRYLGVGGWRGVGVGPVLKHLQSRIDTLDRTSLVNI